MKNTNTYIITDPTEQYLHFRAPVLNLTVRFHQKDGLFYTKDMTTFLNAETGEMIVSVPSNIKDISTWDDLEKTLKISKHSPVYRVIKAIFDGKLIAAKEPEDEYDEDYEAYIAGYEIN